MLKVINLNKKIGGKTLLENLNFSLKSGDRIGLVGESGIGKSTLLRCLGDLENFSGEILSDGQRTLVFQDFNLFPHLTLLENLTYTPIKAQGKNATDTEQKALELIKVFGLSDHSLKYPGALSGGQQQRVAIMRSLMTGAEIIILDEPSSSLDEATTVLVAKYLRNLSQIFIFATHDTLFLETMATAVWEMKAGGKLVDISNNYKLQN